MNVLTLDHVSYTYPGGSHPVVRDACYPFESGQLYAVIGPSGSGKSTLLSMLAGLDVPGEGDVILGEENLKNLDLDKYRREGVSIIFQAFCLLPLLTVRENVSLPMEMQGIPESDARERAAEDERLLSLTLTEKGRARAYEVADERQARAAAFSANLSEEEKDRLIALLDKLLADRED